MNTETVTRVFAPFDSIAEQYDSFFEENIVTKKIRSVVWNSLLNNFKSGYNILELNCGTGTDAIMLSEHGIQVTAIDASEKMIQEARRKSQANGISSVDFLKMSSEEIDKLPATNYGGAFSNFGGLNCVNNPGIVIERVSQLLQPNAPFIVCLLNKICIWEMLAFLSIGKFSQAFRRFPQDGIEASIGDSLMHTWYYTPKEFAKILSPWFSIKKIYGLNIFSPNPSSRSFMNKHPRLTQSLLKIDDGICTAFPFYILGDHFVIEARRK